MRRFDGRRRTGDREAVAARDNRNAELPLDTVEMLIALAVQQRQEQVVVELDLRASIGELAGGGSRREPGHPAAASLKEPERLLALAAVIKAGTMSPMRSAEAATWTL